MDATLGVVAFATRSLGAIRLARPYRARWNATPAVTAPSTRTLASAPCPLPPIPTHGMEQERAVDPAAGRYPTLARIDRALGDAGPGFAGCAGAARLERVARDLTDQYWGETAWLTGAVSPDAFRAVCAALECERTAIGAAVARDRLPAA